MINIILKYKKFIVWNIVLIFILILIANTQIKVQAINNAEEILHINVVDTISAIDDYLDKDNSEYTYRKMVGCYYSTYMNLRYLQHITDNKLEYLMQMNVIYDYMLSSDTMTSDDVCKIKSVLTYIHDNDWADDAMLFDLFREIVNEMDDR